MAEKVMLITGASSGLGHEMALGLADLGFRVFGTFRGEIPPEPRQGLSWIRADMTEHETLAKVVDEVVGRAGCLDCLICNAAVQGIGHIDDLTSSDWNEVLDVNLTAPFLLTQAASPALKQSNGLIVYISSVHGIRAAEKRTAYAVAKAGLLALARNVAADLAGEGVRSVSLILGPFDSRALEQGTSRFYSGATGRQAVEAFAAEQPMGRVGNGSELVGTISFLMSPAAAFITGTEIVVDGGQSSRLSIPGVPEPAG